MRITFFSAKDLATVRHKYGNRAGGAAIIGSPTRATTRAAGIAEQASTTVLPFGSCATLRNNMF